jgi:8-oxo-dGTP pyrophosphatase MutT (NUDIX family)
MPGGGIDYGETILQSLARELSEESGVTPENVRLNDTPLFVTTHAVVNKIPRAILFYKVQLSGDPIKPASSIMTCGWYSADELEDLALSPSVSEIASELKGVMYQSGLD